VPPTRSSPHTPGMSEVSIAPAGGGDARAIASRRQLDDASFRLYLELIEEGNAWAARDQGETVGLALAHATGDEWYVADLFVEQSYRGAHVGQRLFDAVTSEAGDLARAMLVEPGDARAGAILLRRGIALHAPVLLLAGAVPREEELAIMAAGDYRFDVGTIDPAAHGFALDALDRDVRGITRAGDHLRFARSAAQASAFFLNGEFVAYTYVWPHGRIGPIAVSSAAYLRQVLAFSLLSLQRAGASWASLLVPAGNVRLSRIALVAGLKIEGTRLFASDRTPADLSRYAGFDSLLF
jgi:GNAT superfamily N-acetyltransferase